MSNLRAVRIYFDFVSPYSWLALTQLEKHPRLRGVDWMPRPVVYAALLDSNGLVGPAEVPSKRRYTLRDVVRCAGRLGLPLTGPPAHPFRSLEALRTVCVFLDDPCVLSLTVALANACWGEGRPLTDPAVIAGVVGTAGLDAEDLPRRIGAPEVKQRLRDLTGEALGLGVFGVPTFAYEGELFWGHDRLDDLADRLSGVSRLDDEQVKRMLARPRGADRKR